jgi:hypothetical protein
MNKKSRSMEAEPYASICRAMVSSLSEATKVQLEDDEEDESTATTSRPKICLECGYAKYVESKRLWNLRHRAIISESSEMLGLDSLAFSGNLGLNLSPQKPLRRHAQWVARIRKRKRGNSQTNGNKCDDEYIPLELVQLILRAAELSSMLKQAKNELRNSPDRRIQCWSRVDQRAIDIEPILTSIWKNGMPNKSRMRTMDGLLTRAIISVSEIAQHIAKLWAEHWDVELDLTSNTSQVKSYPEHTVKAVNSFVQTCLVDSRHLPHSKSSERLESIDSSSATETSGRKESIAQKAGRADHTAIGGPSELFLDDSTDETKPGNDDSCPSSDHTTGTDSDLLETEMMAELAEQDIAQRPESPMKIVYAKKTRSSRETKRVPANNEATEVVEKQRKMRGSKESIPDSIDEAKPGEEDSYPSSDHNKGTGSDLRVTGMMTERTELTNIPPPDIPTKKRGYVVANAGSPETERQSEERPMKRKKTSKSPTGSSSGEKMNTNSCPPLRRSSRKRVQSSETIIGNLHRPKRSLRQSGSEAMEKGAGDELAKDIPNGTKKLPDTNVDTELRISDSRSVQDSSDLRIESNHQTRKDKHDSGSFSLGEENSQIASQHITTKRSTMEHTDCSLDGMNQIAAEHSDSATVDQLFTKNEGYYVDGGDGSRSMWVKLSHIGHISDYHGFQRRHASFIPLKFKNSVSGTLESIEATLGEVGSAGAEETDAGTVAELKAYEKALRGYKKKQEFERKQRAMKATQSREARCQTNKDDEFEGIISRPILFATSSDKRLPRVTNTSYNTLRKHRDFAISKSLVPSPKFKVTETGTLCFWQDQHSNGKRRSRTSELVELKKISVMMLREMSHTLQFIEEYNKGISNPYKDNSLEETLVRDADNENSIGQSLSKSDINKESELEATGEVEKLKKETTRRADKHLIHPTSPDSWSMKNGKRGGVKLSMVELDHAHLMSDYHHLRRRFQTMYPPPKNSTVEALRECITDIIDRENEKPCTDEEIKREEKAHIRIARGYKGKADQEMIEKKQHEEERLLRLREYEYLTRTRKATPEEIEYEELESRPFRFSGQRSPRKRNNKSCQLGACCSLCAPTAANDSSLSTNNENRKSESSIHNPRFRHVVLDDIDDDDEEEKLQSRRPSRTAELHSLRKASLQKLGEIRHILDFIESYNKGLVS